MAFWLSLLRLVKRRDVSVCAALVAIALGAGGFFLPPTHYESTATMVLTSSTTNDRSAAGDTDAIPEINPLLNVNEGLTTALAILVQALNTPAVYTELGLVPGGSTTVKITDIGGAELLGNKGPFLFISGESTTSADAARDVVVRTEQRARQELLDRQRALKAPESQLISLVFVVPPSESVADHSGRIQGAGFGVGLGLGGTLGVFYLLDTLGTRRRPTATESATSDPETARDIPVAPVATNAANPTARVNGFPVQERPITPTAGAVPAEAAGLAGPPAPVVRTAPATSKAPPPPPRSSPRPNAVPRSDVAPADTGAPRPTPAPRPRATPRPRPASSSGQCDQRLSTDSMTVHMPPRSPSPQNHNSTDQVEMPPAESCTETASPAGSG